MKTMKKIPLMIFAAVMSAAPLAAQHGAAENFVRINGGTFTMGSPSTEVSRGGSEAQHTVTVGAFFMGKYEVTQAEYEAVMGKNPSNFKGSKLPVERVSWYDAVAYCNERSQREWLTPAYTINTGLWDANNTHNGDNVHWTVTWNKGANGYRLPTEAEWEYACRAGTMTPFSTGANITTGQANYNGNIPYNNGPKGQYRQQTWEVGSGAANAWGLYDMHGNVWEWCWDWYGSYNTATETDPTGAGSGSDRVLRGGSWDSRAVNLRSAARIFIYPSRGDLSIGFRLVRSAQ